MNRWSTMQKRVADYPVTRRRLGFALRIEGEQLQRFALFADAQAHRGPITVELALAWACASNRSGPIGPAHCRLPSHIYTDEEVDQLMVAAEALEPVNGLRPATMRCLLGLLAATGLRVSEALHLQQSDVDLDQGLLCVRQTKFRKSRYIPLHPTVR